MTVIDEMEQHNDPVKGQFYENFLVERFEGENKRWDIKVYRSYSEPFWKLAQIETIDPDNSKALFHLLESLYNQIPKDENESA